LGRGGKKLISSLGEKGAEEWVQIGKFGKSRETTGWECKKPTSDGTGITAGTIGYSKGTVFQMTGERFEERGRLN